MQKNTFSENIFIKKIKIPSSVQIQLFPEGNKEMDRNFLKFVGPLGSFLIDVESMDPYGLSFLKITQTPTETFLEIFLKKSTQKKNFTSKGTNTSTLLSQGFGGTLVALFENAIQGVSKGYVVYLDLAGVGFKASVLENSIELKVGQSHELLFQIPKSMKAFAVKPTRFGLYGVDKTQVNQIAAEIRNLKPPEPYKGKGIRYKDEIIVTRIGKKK